LLPEFGSLGEGTNIVEPFTASCPERIDIGNRVYIAAGAWLSVVDHHNGRDYDPRLWIGDGASLGPGLVISCIADVSVGPGVLTGPRVFIGDAYHEYRDPDTAVVDQPMSNPAPVTIGAGAFLGVHCAVLPGVTIGERAYVGANSVVTRDVPANAVVVGNPARVIRRWDPDSARWVAGEAASARPTDPKPPSSPDHAMLAQQVFQLQQRLEVANRARLSLADRLSAADRREAELAAEFETRRAELVADIESLRVDRDREREQRMAVERWLVELQRSISWRATAPLRTLKRGAARRGG
jgi:acetyltransferase-like isoleucine patch superfamily enzyme